MTLCLRDFCIYWKMKKKCFPRARSKKNKTYELHSQICCWSEVWTEVRGRREERRINGWVGGFNFHHFTFLPLPLTFQCEQKRKKKRMCFSVWTILKDQWKGSVIKGPLCLPADCILRSQIPAFVQEDEEFWIFFFFYFTQSCHVLLH